MTAGSVLRRGKYRNLTAFGVVNDLKSLLNATDIAISPLTQGSGSSVKILDYLNFGLPLVSTDIGARGFNFQKNIHYFESPIEDFYNTILMVKSKLTNSNMGRDAREFLIENYSWDRIAKSFFKRLSG
ncbi:MAG: glycosyltransferase [Candidatus Heimdallarchaeota archaeon]|nr:glycosyltransferase [Candidatus Heimdallarchaeota archaeon]